MPLKLFHLNIFRSVISIVLSLFSRNIKTFTVRIRQFIMYSAMVKFQFNKNATLNLNSSESLDCASMVINASVNAGKRYGFWEDL